MNLKWVWLLPALVLGAGSLGAAPRPPVPPRFEIGVQPGLLPAPAAGRLFVILALTNQPAPRFQLGRAGQDAPIAFARDLEKFSPHETATLDEHAIGFPLPTTAAIPPGTYFVQALFAWNRDLRAPDAPGNLYSQAKPVSIGPESPGTTFLTLDQRILPDGGAVDTGLVRVVELPSRLLTAFHGRPISLRAAAVLPRDYDRHPGRRYPLWVRIGGLNTRYTVVNRLMAADSDFRKTWMADTTPRFIMLQLDGAGPFGDPYYVDSANNGPYGAALTRELIPEVEARFRAIGEPRARVLSGVSTGGWVALALQVFYPDFFNGAWAACPDPVDFRALELINIYEDRNAFLNRYGNQRPSERARNGDVALLARREVAMESFLGDGDRYALSGQQWGAWTATFSPRGSDGFPAPLWDKTGKLDKTVAEAWKKYDLRLVLETNWPRLAPKLAGKLHIAAGESDQYFLNNAVHLLDDFFRRATPPAERVIAYGPGRGHGWSNLTLAEMLEQMGRQTEAR